MNELPNPLTPADCDLRDFAFMPLDVVRLRDSELSIQVSGEEFRAAVLLWCAAWHQIPAASLPDDDKTLAQLAGFGRVVAEWRKVRDGALRGWIACADGRLYHPVVAEKARDAWLAKLKQRFKTECGRIKKHCQRHQLTYVEPDFDEWMSQGCPQGQPLSVPKTDRSSPEDTGDMSQGQPGDVPGETHSKGQGEGQGQGQGEVNTLGNTHAVGTPSRASVKPVDLTAAMRRHSIESQPGDPRVAAAVEAGVTVETLEAACVEGKKKKQKLGQFANAGYVLSIAEGWTRDAATPRPASAPRPGFTNARDERRRHAYAVLTGQTGATPSESQNGDVIDVDTKLIG